MSTPSGNRAGIIDAARTRSRLIGIVRSFFQDRGILEVETPVLSQGVSIDRHLDVFSACPVYPHHVQSTPLYLQTSPEFHMKRLLCDGFPDIFQIFKSFRCDESGALHNPEFSILEWYRLGFSMQDLIDEIIELVKSVAGEKQVRLVRYRDLFIEATGLDPFETADAAFHSYCESHHFSPPQCTTRTDLLQFFMTACVEPTIPKENLVFVTHYPADQAILAVLDREDSRTALRFEAYLAGMELANGWEECGDVKENRRRFEEENRYRVHAGKPALPIDSNFLQALERGLPACSGAALGLDRLIMAASGKARIEEVILFPWNEA